MVNDLRSAGARALECPAAGWPASPPFQSGWPLARDTVAVTPRSIVGKRQVFHSKAVGGRRGALKGGGGEAEADDADKPIDWLPALRAVAGELRGAAQHACQGRPRALQLAVQGQGL